MLLKLGLYRQSKEECLKPCLLETEGDGGDDSDAAGGGGDGDDVNVAHWFNLRERKWQ